MKVKNLVVFLLVVVLVFYMGGCENSTPPNKESATKDFHNINESPKNKDKIPIGKKDPSIIKEESEKEKAALAQKNEEMLQQKIREYLNTNSLSGTFAVVRGKHILFNEGAGYANIEEKSLNTASTTYPIGSITKIFVSTSIMMLQERQLLNIQDPVSKYIANFPNGDKIKLYHLLTHTSGIRSPNWQKSDKTPLNLVQEIEKAPIKFQPGEKWDYLDANYMILGYIVEKTSEISLHQFIQENIFNKISLKETGFFTHENPVPYSSVGYMKQDDKDKPTNSLNPYVLFGCGDIYTTAYDMAQFDQALLNGELISKNSLVQMTTPSGTHSKYALGVYNDFDKNYYFSIGVLGGWYSMHAYYKDKDQTQIVILMNSRSKTTEIGNIMRDIYQMVLDSPLSSNMDGAL
ncbi:serine hydrolase domain-containing protein [Neobacillus novalis]|uniref:Serine hydrolase domain-containing protein n=1 Tax=Neobacillus novalis TaxID=220687 RepID=A0AA95SBD8_9BACI|nr:serine hydrolase domain-containing protein [Neobacillus novalis]WHY84898.1 serine hydrolase domain-containing protein [Neobacillus novalis]